MRLPESVRFIVEVNKCKSNLALKKRETTNAPYYFTEKISHRCDKSSHVLGVNICGPVALT